jgi:hypothetical protein
MTRWTGCVMLAALLWAAPIQAAPILSLLPPSGSVAAAPGQTVGWGYQIVNDDPTQWLVITSLIPGLFQHGIGSDLIFDFPILAPGSSWVRPYVPGTQGLYEFTWDATAPVGFVNSGSFTIGAEFWNGDPFLGGQFASALPDFVVPYNTATVPEPSTLAVVAAGLGLAAVRRRSRWSAGRRRSS